MKRIVDWKGIGCGSYDLGVDRVRRRGHGWGLEN